MEQCLILDGKRRIETCTSVIDHSWIILVRLVDICVILDFSSEVTSHDVNAMRIMEFHSWNIN